VEKKRQKIIVCFGDLDYLNVLLNELKSTIDSLRRQEHRFVYFNVGQPPETEYRKRRRKEQEEKIFDQIVDFEDLRTGFIYGLQALLQLLVGEKELTSVS
jgi:hypothetical protein